MQIIKKLTRYKGILILVLLAAVLRFVGIEKIPPSLNWDEVSHGYNAFSILKTGRDEWGRLFPTIFRAYGDYKLPVYIYFTALSESLFGLSTFAVRLPSMLAGVGTVLFAYLLTEELFGKKKVSFLAALLVAIEPWSFFLSRAAFEANLAVFFVVSGVYFFLKGIKKPKSFIISALLLGLSVWTYNSARIFVPMLTFFLVVIYRKEILTKKKKKGTFLHFLLPVAVLLVPMLVQLVNPVGQARYGWVAIIDEGAVAGIEHARNVSSLPNVLNKLVNNRPVYFAKEFVGNYFSHFSPDFLFVGGGTHFQFSVPGKYLLYPINFVFLIFGLFTLLRRREKQDLLLLSWFFLAPIASSLTREAPHVLRSSVILPIPMIISAVGLFYVLEKLKRNIGGIVVFVYVVGVFFSFERYYLNYFKDYSRDYSWSWQYGYEEMVGHVEEYYNEYDKIIITKKYGEPHEFLLFHMGWDPEEFRLDPNLVRFNQSNWYWIDSFDKFYFVNDWQINEDNTNNFVFNLESKEEVNCREVSCLLVTSPDNVPNDWSLVKEVNFLNDEKAFEIYSNQ